MANNEVSCEYFGNMFRAAVRLSILKKVYGYKTDRTRTLEPLPTNGQKMLSPESLRKELAIAEQVAIVATRAPEVRVQVIDPGREPGRLYNSPLVPLQTWPSIPFPQEP